MKVFISLPMKGRTDEEIGDSLEKIKNYILLQFVTDGTAANEDVEFIDNFADVEVEDGVDVHMVRIGEAIKKMAECDMLVIPALGELDIYSLEMFYCHSSVYYRGITTEYYIWNKYKPGKPYMEVPLSVVLTDSEFARLGKEHLNNLLGDE